MINLAAALTFGILLGIAIENYRKRKDLLLDAEREVTFIDGHPYYFLPYDFTEEERHEALRRSMEASL